MLIYACRTPGGVLSLQLSIYINEDDMITHLDTVDSSDICIMCTHKVARVTRQNHEIQLCDKTSRCCPL